jgi:hypothetical protein
MSNKRQADVGLETSESKRLMLVHKADRDDVKKMIANVNDVIQKLDVQSKVLELATPICTLDVSSTAVNHHATVDIYRSRFFIEESHTFKVKLLEMDEKTYSIRELDALLNILSVERGLEVLQTVLSHFNQRSNYLENLLERNSAIGASMKTMNFQAGHGGGVRVYFQKNKGLMALRFFSDNNEKAICPELFQDWLDWSKIVLAMLDYLAA